MLTNNRLTNLVVSLARSSVPAWHAWHMVLTCLLQGLRPGLLAGVAACFWYACDALLSLPCVQDLDPLSTLPRLKYLSLMDNPVTKQPQYRLYVIARCKKLKMLDFRKVKQKVRHGQLGMWTGAG